MPQIQYAFRDDEKTISLLVQGCTENCFNCQIITLSRQEIMPEILDQYMALDIKRTSYPASALTDLGQHLKINEAYKHCMVKVNSQIEFTVNPRMMKRLEEFMPAYNATGLYNFFNGQPYGYIIVLQVFKTTIEIPDVLMERGRFGSAQIMQLYDQKGRRTYYDVTGPITPLIDEGIFENIRDEIIHALRVENALVGIYENDEDSKRLLRQNQKTHNWDTGPFRRIYDENEDIDYSFTDYNEVYRKVIELDSSLTGLVDYVRKIKPPQMAECQTILPKAISGDKTSRTRLVEMYTRNVLRTALYYSSKYNLPIADTIQDGMVGLMMSIDKFDQSESANYQTYFPLWIRMEIQRSMPHYIYTRYYPAHVHETLMTICAIADKMGIIIPPDDEETKALLPQICEETKLTQEQAEKMLNYLNTSIESLDEILARLDEDEVSEDDSSLVMDDTFWESIEKKELKETITDCMATLKPKEKDVLMKRYGMNGDDPKTLEEVGQEFGVTRERIRQIEAKALKKLKHRSTKRLVDFLY